MAVRAAEATLGLKSRTTLELVRRPGTRGEEAKGSLFKHNKQEVNQFNQFNQVHTINSVNSVNSVNRITRRAGDEARDGKGAGKGKKVDPLDPRQRTDDTVDGSIRRRYRRG